MSLKYYYNLTDKGEKELFINDSYDRNILKAIRYTDGSYDRIFNYMSKVGYNQVQLGKYLYKTLNSLVTGGYVEKIPDLGSLSVDKEINITDLKNIIDKDLQEVYDISPHFIRSLNSQLSEDFDEKELLEYKLSMNIFMLWDKRVSKEEYSHPGHHKQFRTWAKSEKLLYYWKICKKYFCDETQSYGDSLFSKKKSYK